MTSFCLFLDKLVHLVTTNAVLSTEKPEQLKVPAFETGAGQYIALHASATVRNSTFLILAFSFHSTNTSFSPSPLQI